MKDLKDWVDYQDLNLSEVDELIRIYKEKRDFYDVKKKEATDAYNEYQDLKDKVMNLLVASGKSKYFAEDVGTVSIEERLSFRTPKGNEEKDAFFNWVKKTHGEQALKGLLTCNHQTLNSFVNEEYDKTGKPADFQIPGLEDPVIEQRLKFRKAK